MKFCKFLPLFATLLAGCFHGRVCLTPPYDAPAGFSESYHAAIQRQEALGTMTFSPADNSIVGPPIFAWPTSIKDAEPPIEW